jgi:hypothetical protein
MLNNKNKEINLDKILLNEFTLEKNIVIKKLLFRKFNQKIKLDLLDINIPNIIYINFLIYLIKKINLELKNELVKDKITAQKYYKEFLFKLQNYNIKNEYFNYLNLSFHINFVNLNDDSYIEFISDFYSDNEIAEFDNGFKDTILKYKYYSNNKINSNNPFNLIGQKRDFHSLINNSYKNKKNNNPLKIIIIKRHFIMSIKTIQYNTNNYSNSNFYLNKSNFNKEREFHSSNIKLNKYKWNSIIFNKLKNTLDSNILNYDTQIIIERFLIDHYIELFKDKEK